MVPKSGKYMWLERDFNEDEDKDEGDAGVKAKGKGKSKGKAKDEEEEEEEKIPDVVAIPEVQVRESICVGKMCISS
jgi:poly [ADP-ribose] polymerase